MESLLKYLEQKIKYYSTLKGDDYFDGMLSAYEDVQDLVKQLSQRQVGQDHAESHSKSE